MKNLPTLYKRASTGKVQQWTIGTNGADIVTEWGQIEGAKQTSIDTIREGKNVGKKNETTPEQQAESEAASQWEKKLKKGYVKTLDDAAAGKRDEIIEGGLDPMLAHRFDEQGHKIRYPAYSQPKLDGHRCIATVNDGVVTLWSRTRKPITSLPHIVAAVEALGLEDGIALDGELYVHPEPPDFVQVPLSKGAQAKVDREDASKVQDVSWCLRNGYVSRNGPRSEGQPAIYMHRVITDAPDGFDVDHINGDKLDNRRENLRICSHAENGANQKLRTTNSSGFKGVLFFKRDETWQAQITVRGVKQHLGYFSTPEEAAEAYDRAAKTSFKEFARPNFEELTSFIRQVTPKEGHEVVQYHVYDVVLDGQMTYAQRLAFLDEKLGKAGHPLQKVETINVVDEDDLMLAFDRFMAQGYEGAMVRNAASVYVGKRSYNLQKVKEFLDAEFTITGVEQGRGKLTGCAIFVLETPKGAAFRAKMTGEIASLKRWFEHPERAIGRQLTVKYQGLTKDGIPRFPIGLRFREDVGGAQTAQG